MNDADLDRDLDRVHERLPEELRRDWAVVPRRFLLQLWLAGVLLGGAAAAVIAGYALDVPALTWAWPMVIIGLMLLNRFWPWWRGDREEEQLRRARSS